MKWRPAVDLTRHYTLGTCAAAGFTLIVWDTASWVNIAPDAPDRLMTALMIAAGLCVLERLLAKQWRPYFWGWRGGVLAGRIMEIERARTTLPASLRPTADGWHPFHTPTARAERSPDADDDRTTGSIPRIPAHLAWGVARGVSKGVAPTYGRTLYPVPSPAGGPTNN